MNLNKIVKAVSITTISLGLVFTANPTQNAFAQDSSAQDSSASANTVRLCTVTYTQRDDGKCDIRQFDCHGVLVSKTIGDCLMSTDSD